MSKIGQLAERHQRVRRLTMATVIVVGACSHASRGVDSSPQPLPAPAPARAPADSTLSKRPLVEMPQSAPRPVRFRAGNLNTVERFVLRVPLPSDSGECGSLERSPTGEGNAVMLYYPSRANPVAVSIVLITTNGRLIRFTDRRGGLRISTPPGLTRAQVDSAIVDFMRTVPRTTITLDYFAGDAFVSNEGGERPSEGFTVPIPYIAHHPRYDTPDDRAHAIVARCR